MISPNLIKEIGAPVVWTITVTNGKVANSNVHVDLTIPSKFTVDSITSTKGILGGTVWTIGSMTVDEVSKMILVLNLNETPEGFEEDFEFKALVTGTVDTILTNNELIDNVTYRAFTESPLAGAEEDKTSCLCVDVSTNDTLCTQGCTEWRFNTISLVNGIKNEWDILTGKGSFTVIDPTENITFTYNLYCTQGDEEYLIQQNVPVTIYPQLSDKEVFDHSLIKVLGGDLTLGMIAVLEAQYPTIDDVTVFDWIILINNDGDILSGVSFPIQSELSGYLCNEDGDIVFVWVIDGVLSFKKPDDTAYLGNVLLLTDCCCTQQPLGN